jgi:hypothetical protein
MAVCDQHKECCNVVVTSSFHLRVDLLEDNEEIIMKFLSKHWNCSLRIVHSDQDLDQLFENKYVFVEKLKGIEKEKYLK